jgi:hypothetical protein
MCFSKKQIIWVALLLCSSTCLCQNRKSQIEITSFYRWDQYPAFNYTDNNINYFTVNIHGTSPGVVATYNFNYHKFLLKTGLGYYRYSFNKISETHSVFPGEYDNRMINYVPPGAFVRAITFATDRYWYHSIFLNTGIYKEIVLSKTIQIVTGCTLNNYFELSGYYHITYPHPGGADYTNSKFPYLGFSLSTQAGVEFKTKKLGITPLFILPVFDLWKQDEIFPGEKNNYHRSKWLGGVGAGISFCYRLSN